MSKRIINDPAVAGWVFDAGTGYWMWGASGGSGGGIPEAPTDGLIYGRQNAGWVEITAGGGDSFWTSTGPNEITYNGTIVVEDAVATG